MTKVALHQLLPIAEDSATNFIAMQRAIAEAAQQGVQLCIFPEDFLYGITRSEHQTHLYASHYASWQEKLCQLAKQYHIALIPGTLPRYDGQNLYGTTMYINAEGTVLTEYSKTHLWLSEYSCYAPGSKLPEVITTPLGKACLIICWDIFGPELFAHAVHHGAEWMIVPAFWSNNQSKELRYFRGSVDRAYPGWSDSKMLDNLIQARVAEYNLGIVFCNFGGTHAYEDDFGTNQALSANRTQIVSPFGSVHGRLANRKPRALICDVPNISQRIADFEIYYGRRAEY